MPGRCVPHGQCRNQVICLVYPVACHLVKKSKAVCEFYFSFGIPDETDKIDETGKMDLGRKV